MKPIAIASLLIAVLGLASHDGQAADVESGKKLHAEKCRSCHAARFGNQGDDIYTRMDRRIDSLTKLNSQVTFCSQQTGAQWFDEEVADVAAYLNHAFYKFPEK